MEGGILEAYDIFLESAIVSYVPQMHLKMI